MFNSRMWKEKKKKSQRDSGQLPTTVLPPDRQNLFPVYLPFFFSKGHSDAYSQPESGHRSISDILIPAALFP